MHRAPEIAHGELRALRTGGRKNPETTRPVASARAGPRLLDGLRLVDSERIPHIAAASTSRKRASSSSFTHRCGVTRSASRPRPLT